MTLVLGAGVAACVQPSEPPATEEDEDLADAQQALTTCVTIQRGVAGDIHDTALLGDYPGWPTGGETSLHTGASSGGNRNISLLKADLSPLPAGATLVSATLNLKASWSADNSDVNVYPVLASWDEATATAGNFDVVNGIGQTAVASFAAGNGGAKTVDVTGLVSQWLSGSLANNGVALDDVGASSHLFWSSESSSSAPSLTVCYDPPVVDPEPPPPSAWSRSPSVTAVGADLDGYTVGTGSLNGSANFGTGTITAVPSSPTTYDVYVVRYAPDGTPLWTKKLGDEAILNNEGPRNQFGSTIATDAAGDMVVAGTFKGQLIDLQSPGNSLNPDVFVIKLDTDGNTVWTKKHTLGTFVSSPIVKMDSQGSSVLTAGCSGALDGVSCKNGTFFVKNDANGNKLWQTKCEGQLGGTGGTLAAFSMDGDDNTIAGAVWSQSTAGSINCGNGTSFIQGASDVILVKHDTDGNLVWMKQFPTSQGGGMSDLAADVDGNIYAAVALFGTGTFGATVLSAGNYLMKFDPNGTLQATLPVTTTFRKLATDPAGNLVVVGSFNGTKDFGFGPKTAIGSTDIYVWKLSPSFTPLSLLTIGTPNTVNFNARIAIDGFGHWSLTGELNGGVYDFGQGGLSGGFLAKILN
ncbi:MAG: DNRLRE domain-containing protein [Polyangiaceae bacterium]